MLIVCHYGELALKGDNRKFFEEKLVENIKKSLKTNRVLFNYVKRISGRILVGLEPKGAKLLPEKELSSLQSALRNVFGLTYFAFACQAEQEIEKIKEKAIEILKNKDFKTFKVETKRGDKNFPLTSQQVNEQVGAYILERSLAPFQGAKLLSRPRVDLENPDIVLYIEITDPIRNLPGSNKAGKYAFLYTEKIAGPAGLPVGTAGKAVSLISGGIDSPVASYLLMKRGVENIFVHFFANQQGYEQSLEKVRELLRVLKKFQFSAKVYFVPFSGIQKEILLKTQADLRVVIYRRFMLKISQIIAEKENAKALITGESVGQVASQTLDNMAVIENACSLPILRPLAGQDKLEIINKAKEIGTFNISILSHQDCCSMFVPKHPQTKAILKEVQKQEKKLKISKLIKSALKNSTIELI